MRDRAAAVAAAPSAEWRRRTAAPEDAEVRRAVRDFLYRMHIIAALDADEAQVPVPLAFTDAVLNGAALCQLVATLLRDGGALPAADPVPCRCPRTLDEVRVNYAVAVAALRGAPDAAQRAVPRSAWTVTPEDVFSRTAPAALLGLFVHLISTYLPAPEELPAWRPQLCWQPAADGPRYARLPPADLVAAEAQCCAFLQAWAVLPDPAVYHLPGDECLLPAATAAPFMPKWADLVPRPTAPASLCVPSVWPYVCNGALLVQLVRRTGLEATARAASRPAGTPFFANPRTLACCAANVAGALRCVQVGATHKLPLPFVSEASVAAVLRGERLHILQLLLHLRDAIESRAARPPLGAPVPGTPATPASRSPPAAKKGKTPPGGVVTPSPAAAPRAPSTAAATAACSVGLSPPPAPLPVAPQPSLRASGEEGRHRREAGDAAGDAAGRRGLLGWLCGLLGPDYRHTAADASFVFEAATATWQEPCLFLSDGVVLAHVVALLECRRCAFLECVRPTRRKAAKLFNVRRCLEFLRLSAGVVFDLPLLDEALTEGRVEGVVSVLQALHRHYCLAHPRHPSTDA